MNILAVDDHPLYLESLERLLKDQIPQAKISTAFNGNQAVEILERVNPVLMILDINMPGMGGLEVAKYVTMKYPSIKIIVLTHKSGMAMMLNLIPFVHGFLYKEIRQMEFKKCIDTILNGGKYFCQKTSKLILYNNYKFNDLPEVWLTNREMDILRMLREGKTSKEIADKLHLSVKTVKSYREDLLRKTKTKNSTELIEFVNNNSILPEEQQDNEDQ